MLYSDCPTIRQLTSCKSISNKLTSNYYQLTSYYCQPIMCYHQLVHCVVLLHKDVIWQL